MRKTLGRLDGNPFTDPLVKPEGGYAYYAPPSEDMRILAKRAVATSNAPVDIEEWAKRLANDVGGAKD